MLCLVEQFSPIHMYGGELQYQRQMMAKGGEKKKLWLAKIVDLINRRKYTCGKDQTIFFSSMRKIPMITADIMQCVLL